MVDYVIKRGFSANSEDAEVSFLPGEVYSGAVLITALGESLFARFVRAEKIVKAVAAIPPETATATPPVVPKK